MSQIVGTFQQHSNLIEKWVAVELLGSTIVPGIWIFLNRMLTLQSSIYFWVNLSNYNTSKGSLAQQKFVPNLT